MKKVPTYAQRVARIQRPGDEELELRRAKEYVRNLKREVAQAASWEQKRPLLESLREAEAVLRRLRLNIFQLEGLARARLHARLAARQDERIMWVRSLAAKRGATPIEVQRNVHAMENLA